MTTTFEFVREQLIAAGRSGVSQADLFVALRQADIARRRKGTYSSFHSKFFILVRLGWVERMKKTAPATTKYGNLPDVLADKTFYRITRQGRDTPDSAWVNPLVTNYPEYEDQSRYYTPTGRPRGRPRVERVRRRRAERRERAAAPEERPVVAEPVRERRRRLRIPVSQQIESELPALRESIEALRASKDTVEVNALEIVIQNLYDRVLDALEGASGEERERLNSLAGRLQYDPEVFLDMTAGISRGNQVTLQRGIESLLLTIFPE